MSDSGEQIASFFLYSLFVFPITNYLISPQRAYPRWKAAFYAVAFLTLVTAVHLAYENSEKGPNHYELLGVTRDSTTQAVKKSYRSLSLLLHPDKNPSPDAADEFNKVKTAFDVLTDKDLRREYNRLGTFGVESVANMVIDHRFILLQLMIQYGSSLAFAFLMTMSEPTGDAMKYTLFGLAVMLLLEGLLTIEEVPLPGWFFPRSTAYDVVTTLHRVFPSYMNACRCVSGAYFFDRKAANVQKLEEIGVRMVEIMARCDSAEKIVDGVAARLRTREERRRVEQSLLQEADGDLNSAALSGEISPLSSPVGSSSGGVGSLEASLQSIRRLVALSKEGRAGLFEQFMDGRSKVMADPALLAKYSRKDVEDSSAWHLLAYWALYMLARYIYARTHPAP